MPVDLMQGSQEKEVWKPVLDYENFYSISNKGRLKSERKNTNTFIGRIIKSSLNARGYPSVSLCKNNVKKTRKLARIVMEAFVGRRPINLQINHIDCNVLNSNLSNLEYVTQSRNTKHAYENGLIKHYKGEDSHMAKLNRKQVRYIRKLYSKGNVSQQKIADMFNVTQTSIGLITRRINWAWLK